MAREFDAVALHYDQTFTHTATGKCQRERVWHFTAKILSHQSGKALELNAGTGEDALWLSKQGWQVLATDISPDMLLVAQHKKNVAGIQPDKSPFFQTLALEELDKLEESGFDLIFSNFGGLNCLDPEALQQAGAAIVQKLNPGGHCIAVVMSSFCWWEFMYFLVKGKFAAIFRRQAKGPLHASLDAQTSISTWYYSPQAFSQIMAGKQLMQRNCQPIGFWLPPSYLEPFFGRRPKTLAILYWLEKHLAPAWFAPAADHFLIHFTKK
ncbi:MAG TPA: class I SAM-dependent methyltransferase [Saprospiraceae bacterium]|nr:class I SAM-dependent methyltransferase [Saprospiraceae bacterium]